MVKMSLLKRPLLAAVAILALAVLLAAGAFAAFGRLRAGAPPAPNCGNNLPAGASPTQPATAAGYTALGDALYDQGNCAGAIAAYSRAVALDPESAEAYNNRAYTEMAQQDYASALPDLDTAIALRPDYVNALMNRGDIYNYYYHIDYAKAVADYDHVLALPGGIGRDHTSVCGHRLLAQHHGWDLGVLVTAALQRGAAGCG